MRKLSIPLLAIILTSAGCGAQLCARQEKITLWKDLYPISNAADFIESYTCDFLDVVETDRPDIYVRYDNRGCSGGGASYGRVSILSPDCGYNYDITLGVAVHELLHALGHWHHDVFSGDEAFGHSVMESTLQNNWHVDIDDWEWIMDTYCAPAGSDGQCRK